MKLETKYKYWKFNLRNDNFFPCLPVLAKHCEELSYQYDRRTGYSVCMTLKREMTYEDVTDSIYFLALNIYPVLKQKPGTSVKQEEANLYEGIVLGWLSFLIGFAFVSYAASA